VRVVNWLVVQRLLSQSRGDVCFLDQGAMQELWSGSIFAQSTSEIEGFAGSGGWQRPDVVVELAADSSVAMDRLVSRSSRHSRLQPVAGADNGVNHAKAARLIEEIHDWVGSGYPMAWITVDASRSRSAMAEAVEEALWPHLPASGRRPG
jgi:hypothetical protein